MAFKKLLLFFFFAALASSNQMHTVQFKFKSDVPESTKQNLTYYLLSLKERCILPATGRPYIISAVGGRDNSPEGLQNGYTHGFVFEFLNPQDRDFYAFSDPAHAGFKAAVKPVIDGVQVLDNDLGRTSF